MTCIPIIMKKSGVNLLQTDLDNLNQWRLNSKMKLNCTKCYHIKLTSKHNNIPFEYNIRGDKLKEITAIRDSGIH